jgi:hypothetical protein
MDMECESEYAIEETSEDHAFSQSNAPKHKKTTVPGGKVQDNMNSKRKHKSLTLAQKIDICKTKASNPGIKNTELAAKYGVGQSTIHDILKKKDRYLSRQPNSYTASLRRERAPKYPNIEQALALWIDQATNDNCTLSGHILLAKAASFAQRFGIEDFKGSQGWLEKFKKRYNVQEYVRCGEANSANLLDLRQQRRDLQKVLERWDLKDVFNCDETALYWKLEPSRTLARQPIAGTKKPKDRVTILLACNATGTERLTPVFVHKYKKPRCMRYIDQKTLPVYYYWNSSAWMQLSIFSKWLSQVNSDLRKQQRKILMLMDNATVHSIEESNSFSNIVLHYLPKNTTAHLQPCDAGIIYSFKASNFICFFCFICTKFVCMQ